jgi:hypothetical protein
VELKLGFSYLTKEDKPKQCFEVFSESLKQGYEGLCITRTNPRQIKAKFDVGDVPIHWLTDRKSAEGTTISPALENLSYLIEGFIKKNEKSFVLVDGLEYLISVNKFNPVLQFIRRLVDFVSEHDSIFVIPISPLTIGEQELKTLEREMEPVTESDVIILPSTGGGGQQSESPKPAASSPGPAVETAGTETGAPAETQSAGGGEQPCTPCEGTGTCFWCSGSGSCESCTGTGKNEDGSPCDDCSGSGICDSCKGSKQCTWCKGTGKLIES